MPFVRQNLESRYSPRSPSGENKSVGYWCNIQIRQKYFCSCSLLWIQALRAYTSIQVSQMDAGTTRFSL
ncbi:hypothetical protein AYX13_05046 [Cryptococcus neoformans]|nr:hypothetical protein AYX13_05046 [Cryptococcus neoformans var. grubii]